MGLPATANRVAMRTPPSINFKIAESSYRSIRYYSTHEEMIPERLYELDDEWDIERTVETNASILILLGLGLGVTVSRKFLLLPTAVSAFLLQHALQGWCPPISLLRRLGVRTQAEIEAERHALISLQQSEYASNSCS